MYVQTKNAVLICVKNRTRDFQKQVLTVFTANHISEEINISRNLASQYLNELFKEGVLIKISSRPVYFLHKAILEELFGSRLKEPLYWSVEELMASLEKEGRHDWNLEKIIGFQSSLSCELEQCKAALNYPPHGLPILISGQEGTGKELMVRLLKDYAVRHLLIQEKSRLVIVPCQRYQEPKNAKAALFGTFKTVNGKKERQGGYIAKAGGGILFLQDVHYLGQEIQELLCTFLDTRLIKEGDEEGEGEKTNIKMIFSTSQVPETALEKKLLRKIPVIVKMPALQERPGEDKEQLIFLFFREEAERTGKRVMISGQVLDTLLHYNFPGNIGQLKTCVQTSCANALLESKDKEELDIYLYHLPEFLISSARVDKAGREEGRNMLGVIEFERDSTAEVVKKYSEGIFEQYKEYRSYAITLPEYLSQAFETLNRCYDHLIFEKRFSNVKVNAMERVLEAVFEDMTDRYYIQFPVKFAYIFSRFLYLQMKSEQTGADDRIKGCLELFSRNFAKESMLAAEIAAIVKQSLDITVGNGNLALLILGIKQYNQNIRMDTIRGIIICHGYATASSMADMVNKVMNCHIFEAMDMPVDIPFQDIAVKFKKYIQHVPGPSDVILLVDMGSLEDIDILLNSQSELNLGIINNVSTRLAVDVGSKIQKGLPMKEILEESSANHLSTYKLILRRKKQAAVLFVSEAGSIVAKRMSELFYNSLPEQTEVEFVPCDYLRLLHSKFSDEIFDNYEVLFISGTMDPQIGEVLFIPMEDIVSFKEIDKINNILADHLDAGRIQAFNQNLMKNFSLQNVVQYLTILNADKVLDLVGEAVDRIQQRMGKKFSAKTRIGLNIHISCLIERLVTKSPIEVYSNLASFAESEQDFIESVSQSFSNILAHYGVKLPVSEIAYIYDYIYHDDGEREEKSD